MERESHSGPRIIGQPGIRVIDKPGTRVIDHTPGNTDAGGTGKSEGRQYKTFFRASRPWCYPLFKWATLFSPALLLLLFVMDLPWLDARFELFSGVFLTLLALWILAHVYTHVRIMIRPPEDAPHFRQLAVLRCLPWLFIGIFPVQTAVAFTEATLDALSTPLVHVTFRFDENYSYPAELRALLRIRDVEITPGSAANPLQFRRPDPFVPAAHQTEETLVHLLLGKTERLAPRVSDLPDALDPLKGRQDYPSLAVRPGEGTYNALLQRCTFPLHAKIPEDYRQFLERTLEVQFGTVNLEPVLMTPPRHPSHARPDNSSCLLSDGRDLPVLVSLTYPLLFLRNEGYTLTTEVRTEFFVDVRRLNRAWRVAF